MTRAQFRTLLIMILAGGTGLLLGIMVGAWMTGHIEGLLQ